MPIRREVASKRRRDDHGDPARPPSGERGDEEDGLPRLLGDLPLRDLAAPGRCLILGLNRARCDALADQLPIPEPSDLCLSRRGDLRWVFCR